MYKNENIDYDAVIVGAGFYGVGIALYLLKKRDFKRVLLIERQSAIMQRASYVNQARIHNGYHYPRSFITAYRSRINQPKFLSDWPGIVKKDFSNIYAISRRNSKITALQFKRFCREIGAKIELADPSIRALFNPRMIEDIFRVEEYVFDSTKLALLAQKELNDYGVRICLNSEVVSLKNNQSASLDIVLKTKNGVEKLITSKYVFNCTYSGINQLKGSFSGTHVQIKHEVAEIALIKLPRILDRLAITVMDGPFFSIMPFPSQQMHTLSHVRYTPHISWEDDKNVNPYKRLAEYEQQTRITRMLRDGQRYLPMLAKASYVKSLFEIKTVLLKNEVDDGRPILYEKHLDLPGCYSVLGGKIDNIYDVLERLDCEIFSRLEN